MKITVSGWPGAGTSTLSLILAKNLGVKLYRGTESFRYLGKALSYSNTGEDRFKADIYLEKFFGPVYDKFIDYKLLEQNPNHIIIESDIAAFRIGLNDEIFSVFLITDDKVRRERLKTDSRDEDVELLEARDKENAQFYKELHGINWFDKEEIKEKHRLVLDNSNITIAEEITEICEKLSEFTDFNEAILSSLMTNAENEEKIYWQNGKEWYINFLKENGLLADAEEVLSEIKELFAAEIAKFPEELKVIFDKIKYE